MHKKKVIDLQNYRDGEAENARVSDEGEVNLRAGTALLFGQYTILGYINCGGFGITYLAEDSLGRKVAVKECFPGELCYRTGNEMRPRSPSYKAELEAIVDHFVKEAQRLASLKHDNIVHVHQVFEENATAYIVMDYVDGPDLLDIAESEDANLDPAVVEALTEKMLHAIAYVHSRGILHRDISPDNILIKKNGEPVLIDFGAAQRTSETTASVPTRLKFVKDGYSPQEFYIPDREQGPWSDLYSFAASLHHVIAGYAPEDGQKRLAALAAKETDPYQPLAGRIEGYSPGFLKAIDKALETLPANRIQSAEDWHAMLGGNKPAPIRSKRPRPLSDRSGLMALPIENFAASLIQQTEKKRGLLLGSAVAASVALIAMIGYFAFGSSNAPADAEFAVAPASAEASLSTAEATQPSVIPEVESDGIAKTEEPPVEIALAPTEEAPAPDSLPADLPSAVEANTPNVSEEPIATQANAPGDDLPLAIASANDQAPTVPVIASLPTTELPVARAPHLIGQSPEVAGITLPETLDALSNAPAVIAQVPDWSKIAKLPVHQDKLNAFEAPSALAAYPRVLLALAAPQSGEFGTSDAQTPAISQVEAVLMTAALPTLPKANGEVLFNGDVSPPAYVQKLGSILKNQVAFSHWDVTMPFESSVERVRNSNTETITAVSSDADLATSGAWIKEGVVIYSFNGARLEPDTPISVHALNNLNIDPDGYMRASVRYRDPDTGTIDRGLLAVPVVREIGLADGTRLEARKVDLNWVLVVTEAAPGSNLRIGDRLEAEQTSGVNLNGHEALAKALDRLVAVGAETATFSVTRDGSDVQVVWQLGRET